MSGCLSQPIQLFPRPTACEKELRSQLSHLFLIVTSADRVPASVSLPLFCYYRGHDQIGMDTLRSTLRLSHTWSGGTARRCQRPLLVWLADTEQDEDASGALT